MTKEEKFLKLVKEREELKERLKANKEELTPVLEEIGLDTYLQDESGLVYKVCVPKGTFITFDHIGYKRSRRKGESGGQYLSKSECQEAGFEV